MQAIKSIPSPSSRRPTSLELAATIQLAREAAARLRRRVGRFEIYDLLDAIYRVYIDWKRRKITKRSARVLADRLSIVRRKGMSPFRILVEATFPGAHVKQKSRWVRALEYVHSENVSPSQFRKFIRTRGGAAGCAGMAVNVNRKRRRPGGDWID
jgi:sulfite reductase beta subunit-like hemoprotein